MAYSYRCRWGAPSTGSPITFMIRPRVARQPARRLLAGVDYIWPRRPSVESIAMVRTEFSPNAGQPQAQIAHGHQWPVCRSECVVDLRQLTGSNSTRQPRIIREILPILTHGTMSSAAIGPHIVIRLCCYPDRFGAGNDLHQLGGDGGLPRWLCAG